jgi:hypothetical protein
MKNEKGTSFFIFHSSFFIRVKILSGVEFK